MKVEKKRNALRGFVSGYVVKGFFPRGEEWVFISKDGTILFHSFLIDLTALYVRKLIEKNEVWLRYDKKPQSFTVDHFQIKTRLLTQEEIIFFAEQTWEARKKVHRKMPMTLRQARRRLTQVR